MSANNTKTKCLLVGLIVLLVFAVPSFGEEVKNLEKKIKIGVAGPMRFAWGKNMWAGAQLAAEEINNSGGVLMKGEKYNLELVQADSNDYRSVIDATNAIKRLISVDKVDLFIAGARSEAILAQQEVIADHQVIYVFSGGGSPALHTPLVKDYERYKYFFNMFPNAAYHFKTDCAVLDMVAAKIRQELGIDKPKVALVIEKAKWADAFVRGAESVLPGIGLEIVGVWRPSPFASDLTSEITALKSAGAHIIFEVFTGPAGVIFNKQVGEFQIPAIVVGVNAEGGGMGQQYWDETNGMCEYETMIASDFSNVEITEKTIPVYYKLVEKLGGIPFTVGFCCYDAVYVIKQAFERANTLESDALVVELEKTNYIGTQGRIAFFPRGHKFVHDAKWGPGFYTMPFFQLRDGKMLCVWPSGRTPHPAIEAGQGWAGFKYKGTVDLKLPPRLGKYWKK